LRSTRLSLLIFLVAAALAPSLAAAGEPFFPRAGNQGYDALGYAVKLTYKPGKEGIVASTTMTAEATESLGRISLDFFGPRVEEVRVDGQPVSFRRRPGKLIVHPRERIAQGSEFAVGVRYSGRPPKITDPDQSQEGWIQTDDGVLAVGEPLGTAAWIPCNDVPADKARFDFAITVSDNLKAVANGRRGRSENKDAGVTFHWSERAPMSPYLAVLDIGRGRIVENRVGGLPTWTLVDPRLARASRRPLSSLPEVVRFLSRRFGRYPFGSAGSIVDYAPSLGYALESQSRPIYAFAPDLTTLVHETAHQWFGDAVGIEHWPQIWLNEGFATWTEWYYAEHHGGRSAHEIFERLLRVLASEMGFWNPPSGRPASPKHLFGPSIYIRGAMALQALREKIGSKPMLRLLRRWVAEHRYGSATTGEFVSLAERVSGRDLGGFFRRWLYRPGKP
jgi:aminopeptidase N